MSPNKSAGMLTDSRLINCSEMFPEPSSNDELWMKLDVWERCFFSYLATSSKSRWTRSVGIMGAVWYVSPGNLFLGPVSTFASDINYLDVLAGGLAYTGLSVPYEIHKYFRSKVKNREIRLGEQEESRLYRITGLDNIFSLRSLWDGFNPLLLKLGDLPKTPRFFFNTTSLENGLPFVLTQNITHFSSDTSPLRTARLDTLMPHSKPLSRAYTLEEINSSPSTFPLAHAAMASAAFPLGLEPLEIVKYGYRDGFESLYPTQDRLHLTDGGVFDNSGLTTLSDLVQYLMTSHRGVVSATAKKSGSFPKTIILISINAEADDYNLEYPRRSAEYDGWMNTTLPFSLFDLNLPLRTGALGVKALEAIHFTNKRRAEEIAVREVMHLVDLEEAERGINLLYFPISFSQLSENDRNKIDDPDKLYSRVKAVPTSFGISGSDELVIEQAANAIISSKQKNGWAVGPKCNYQDSREKYEHVYTLGEALAFALLRKHNKNELDESNPNNIVVGWCKVAEQEYHSKTRPPS